MAVSVQSFTQFVENQVAAIQGYCSTLVDFTVGSILRAFVEATAAMGLWLEAVALQVAALSRAQTSSGTDLDSFYAQFSFQRLPPIASSGIVTFSRFTNTSQANIPVGALVQSFDGSQQFAVVADTTNAAFNAGLGVYVLPAGQTSIAVAVVSVTAAAKANVTTGTVTQIVTAIPYVDTVTNAAPFVGGSDAESDSAYRARFVLYIAALSKATKAAVAYAASITPGLSSYVLVENQSLLGAPTYGYFYVVADNGTGSPSSGFLSTLYSAIDSVRPLGTYFSVIAPTTLAATITMTATAKAGYTHASIAASIQSAVTAYIASLGIGNSLSYSRIAQVAYDSTAGVANITGLLLNGGTADLTVTSQQEAIAGTVTVN